MQNFQFKKEALVFSDSLCSHAGGKKVHPDLCFQSVWNVCLQTSWRNPQDLSSCCLRNFSKSFFLINSCQVGKLMQQNSSFQISSRLQWKKRSVPLSNLIKKVIVLIPLFGSFFFLSKNLSWYERCCWWYFPMEKPPLKGDLVLCYTFSWKPSHEKFNCTIKCGVMICRLMILILQVNHWTQWTIVISARQHYSQSQKERSLAKKKS